MARRAGLHGGGSGRPRDWVAQRPRAEAVPFSGTLRCSGLGTLRDNQELVAGWAIKHASLPPIFAHISVVHGIRRGCRNDERPHSIRRSGNG